MFRLGTDRFELLRQVGEGSYGVVYEARDRETDKPVALKLLHRADEIAEGRFEREASVLAELSHPAIVRYVAHGATETGQRYLVMEWLSGFTLERQLRSRRPVAEVLAFARRVVAGLAYAEVRGVIHRDLKPANLFLVDGSASAAKIVDFGLARRASDRSQLTHTGFVVGTPLYMSPEQARGDAQIDARTDVFSLGSVLYHCLTGEEPFLASQPLAILSKIVFEEPHPLERVAPHVPPPLRELVHAMLRKKPDERPTMRALAQQLAAIADELSTQQLSSGAESATSEVLRVEPLRRQNAASLSRHRQSVETRVLSAVFVRELEPLPAPLATALHATAARLGARAEPLLDGSRVVIPSQKLGVTEHAVVSARCALAIQHLLGERAQIAVCIGRAMVGDVLPVGELYERGAALLARTPRGQLRLDEASAALLDARFELAGESDARTLVRERSGADAPRTVLGQASAFVGRERELSQLQLSFDECVEELVARVVLVTAPAGAGKSRLLHELIERLRASESQFTLLMARGDALRAGTQFGLLAPAIQGWAGFAGSDNLETKRSKLSARLSALVGATRAGALAHFLGEMIGVPYPDDASPELRAARSDHQLMSDRTLTSWLEWIEAVGTEPVLFCVEDLHWSDPASLRYLDAALRNARERALMVLALARPALRESFPNLFAERELTEIRLPKLGARACARLLDALASELTPALREVIILRADGNPFFLEELLRSLHGARQDESLPESILAIVQARIDALGDEPKQLVRAASVYGQSFRLDGLRALFDADDAHFDLEGALALLCEREVIFRRGPVGEQEFEFRHALIREAAYLLLPDEERALGHRLAATWLEQQGDAPALLAQHYERGGVPELAARWYARAAEQAFESGSLDDVARSSERAIECGLQGEALGKVAALLAEARSYSEDNAGAARWAEQARSLLTPAQPAWWRATQVGAVAFLRMGRAELDQLAADMIAHFEPATALPDQALAMSYLTNECLRLIRDDLAQPLLSLLRAAPAEAMRGRAEGCLGSALALKAFFGANLSEALRHARAALEAQRRAGALRDVADTSGLAGYFAHELGQYDDAERDLCEQVQLGRRLGSSRDVLYAQMVLGSVHARKRALDAAEACLREALAGSGGQASYQAEAHAHLANVLEQRGDLDAAERELDRARALENVEPGAAAYVLARASSLASRRGEHERALALANEAMQMSREHGVYELVGFVRLRHLECLLAAGQREAAQAALVEARAWLDARAAKIDDARLRASFLEQVAEHARLRELQL